MTEMLDVTVVIVTFNSRMVIGDCLASIVNRNGPNTRILVVDNSSTDGTRYFVEHNYPQVEILALEENFGFAKALNRSIPLVTTRFVCLVNPDTVLGAGVLSSLEKYAKHHPDCGIVAPSVVKIPSPLKISSAGLEPTPARMVNHFLGVSRFARALPFAEGLYILQRHLQYQQRADWVTGACFLVSRADWVLVNGMSERWFMYAEDIDFCRRIRNLGKGVICLASITVNHKVGQSSGSTLRDPRLHRSAWLLNLFDYYKTELGGNRFGQLLWVLAAALGLSVRGIAFGLASLLVKRQNRGNLADLSRRNLETARDAMSLQMGQPRNTQMSKIGIRKFD